jgi:hypothetical protein
MWITLAIDSEKNSMFMDYTMDPISFPQLFPNTNLTDLPERLVILLLKSN